jgi:hypothetical protein
MDDAVLAGASLIIALAAVAVAIWQVRASAKATERTNSLPIMSAAFDEFRSADFQGHLRRVWNEAPADVPESGFQALPDEWRGSAYRVAYFFEYLGLLVAYELAPRDSIIDFSANLVVRSWRALEPFIEAERRYREGAGGGVSSGFVSHFEHLVVLTMGQDGHPVDSEIHEKLSLKRVADSESG